jgi:acyl carrier protein
MLAKEIETKIKKEMSDQHGYTDIAMDDDLEMIGMDSLDEIEMLMFIEDEFQLDIADSSAKAWETLRDVVNYLENRGA